MCDKNLVISPRVGWRVIGGAVVAFNCANQEIMIWNDTASELWQQMAKGASIEQLVHWLSREYAISSQVAKKDIMAFLHEANSGGFLSANVVAADFAEIEDGNGERALIEIEMEAIQRLIPFAVTFEVTYSCNERCIHCYMGRGLPSLALKDVLRALDELAEEGCLFVSFTGGEFFTRADWLAILNHASSLHFAIDVLTNGTLVTQEAVTILASISVRRVQISLYGAFAATHDSITRMPGSFDRTVQSVKMLREAGVKVEIAFPMMKQNFGERHRVKRLVAQMGCVLSPSHIITARNSGEQDTFLLRLSDDDIAAFLRDRELSALYAGRRAFKDHQFYLDLPDVREAAPCYAGFNSCAISPSGKVFPCNQLLYEVGDLQKQGFSDIWQTSLRLKFLRQLQIKNLPKCVGCDKLLFCTRCPGLALLEGGDLLGISPENCRIAAINSSIERREA